MITLTYGQKIPEAREQGVPVFQMLEDNFTRLDGHTHDGVDSPLLTSQAFAGVTDTISAAGWVTYGGPIGHYRQLVTIHTGFTFDSTKLAFRTSTGAFIYPTVERVSNTTYYVYTTDATQDYLVMHGG